MLVHDNPLILNFAQTDREAEVELTGLSIGFPPSTTHQGHHKRHVITGGDVHLADVEYDGVMRPGKEQVPRLAVRVDSL